MAAETMVLSSDVIVTLSIALESVTLVRNWMSYKVTVTKIAESTSTMGNSKSRRDV